MESPAQCTSNVVGLKRELHNIRLAHWGNRQLTVNIKDSTTMLSKRLRINSSKASARGRCDRLPKALGVYLKQLRKLPPVIPARSVTGPVINT